MSRGGLVFDELSVYGCAPCGVLMWFGFWVGVQDWVGEVFHEVNRPSCDLPGDYVPKV